MKKDGSGNIIVEMAGMYISNSAKDVLVTYSLGSCVGVCLYDPFLKIGGMIHCMLPLSSIDKNKAIQNPSMFVDTGLVKLIDGVLALGSEKRNLICKVAGAGSPLEDVGSFRIGERNYAVLKKILWKNEILIKGELIGGKSSKTLFLNLETGKTIVRTENREEIEL